MSDTYKQYMTYKGKYMSKRNMTGGMLRYNVEYYDTLKKSGEYELIKSELDPKANPKFVLRNIETNEIEYTFSENILDNHIYSNIRKIATKIKFDDIIPGVYEIVLTTNIDGKVISKNGVAMEIIKIEKGIFPYLDDIITNNTLNMIQLVEHIEKHPELEEQIMKDVDLQSFQKCILFAGLINHCDLAERNIVLSINKKTKKIICYLIDLDSALNYGGVCIRTIFTAHDFTKKLLSFPMAVPQEIITKINVEQIRYNLVASGSNKRRHILVQHYIELLKKSFSMTSVQQFYDECELSYLDVFLSATPEQLAKIREYITPHMENMENDDLSRLRMNNKFGNYIDEQEIITKLLRFARQIIYSHNRQKFMYFLKNK